MHPWLVFVFFSEYNPAERGKANRITGNKGALKKREKKKKRKDKIKVRETQLPIVIVVFTYQALVSVETAWVVLLVGVASLVAAGSLLHGL